MRKPLISFFISLSMLSTLFCEQIICIGDTTLESLACISNEEFKKTGFDDGQEASVSADIFNDQLSKRTSQQYILGSAAHTAKELARLGYQVSLISHIGNDTAGEFIQSVMQQHHVHMPQKVNSGTTSRKLRLITPEGKKASLFCQGTTGTIEPTDLLFQDASIVHHDGMLLNNKSLLEASLDICARRFIRSSLELCPLAKKYREYLLQTILPRVNILLGSTDEMLTLFDTEKAIDTALRARSGISVLIQETGSLQVYFQGKKTSIPLPHSVRIDDDKEQEISRLEMCLVHILPILEHTTHL